jgi:hypothetical protein
MNEQAASGVHWSFWLIGAIALLWNVAGAANYLVQVMNPEAIDSYREAERALIDGRPAWATGAFAIAVFGGSIGCLLLLLRKSAAFYVFVVSLLGVMLTILHVLNVVGWRLDLGALMPPLTSLVVAAVLVWYSKHAEGKRWIS